MLHHRKFHYDSYKVFFFFVILSFKETHKGIELTSYQPAPTTGAHNLQSFIKPIESQQLILLMEFNVVYIFYCFVQGQYGREIESE